MKPSIGSPQTVLWVTGICAWLIAGCGEDSNSRNEISIQEMNRALSVMSTSPLGLPRRVDELTNFPAFKGRRFCAPPAGKKFVIDRAIGQVVVVEP